MKLKKGCENQECIAYRNKEKFSEDTVFCPHCKQKLSLVCAKRNCYVFLEDDPDSNLCAPHRIVSDQNKKKVRKAIDHLEEIGAGFAAVFIYHKNRAAINKNIEGAVKIVAKNFKVK